MRCVELAESVRDGSGSVSSAPSDVAALLVLCDGAAVVSAAVREVTSEVMSSSSATVGSAAVVTPVACAVTEGDLVETSLAVLSSSTPDVSNASAVAEVVTAVEVLTVIVEDLEDVVWSESLLATGSSSSSEVGGDFVLVVLGAASPYVVSADVAAGSLVMSGSTSVVDDGCASVVAGREVPVCSRV